MMPLILALSLWLAAPPAREGRAQTFMVEGVERQALVFENSVKAPAAGAPLVLVFHGHGGNARAAARKFRFHELWPEAVVAYMQGQPGVVGITDAEGRRNGWQKSPGELNDRDVKFVDAALAQLAKQYKIDPARIYAMGHSNGARFVNVLWNMRGDKFAAFASAAAQGGTLLKGVKPKPVFLLAGERDPIVPFQGQMLSVNYIRRLFEIDPQKTVTAGHASYEYGKQSELVAYLHPGGHEVPDAALPLMVKFFQSHAAK